MAYFPPYVMPQWVDTDVPSEYHDYPQQWSYMMSPLAQEPAIIESFFSMLRNRYPYLHDTLVDNGIQFGLPSKERLARMYEQGGYLPMIVPGGDDSPIHSPLSGLLDPDLKQALFTLHPNYKNLMLHEAGHYGVESSPTWSHIMATSPVPKKQRELFEGIGYMDADDREINEEAMLRKNFPVDLNDEEIELTPDQEYIARRFSDFLKYGPTAGDFR